MKYEQRVTQMTIVPKSEPLFAAMATTVTIEDQAGGEYVVIESRADDGGKVAVNPGEWPLLRDAVDKMIAACRG